jgi:hypothetical protein
VVLVEIVIDLEVNLLAGEHIRTSDAVVVQLEYALASVAFVSDPS